MAANLECCQKKSIVNKINIHISKISNNAQPNKWYLKNIIDHKKFNVN